MPPPAQARKRGAAHSHRSARHDDGFGTGAFADEFSGMDRHRLCQLKQSFLTSAASGSGPWLQVLGNGTMTLYGGAG